MSHRRGFHGNPTCLSMVCTHDIGSCCGLRFPQTGGLVAEVDGEDLLILKARLHPPLTAFNNSVYRRMPKTMRIAQRTMTDRSLVRPCRNWNHPTYTSRQNTRRPSPPDSNDISPLPSTAPYPGNLRRHHHYHHHHQNPPSYIAIALKKLVATQLYSRYSSVRSKSSVCSVASL